MIENENKMLALLNLMLLVAFYVLRHLSCMEASPLASMHDKQRTQIHDMLPQLYYNETFILLTRDFS
jgi:hypothetical protein